MGPRAGQGFGVEKVCLSRGIETQLLQSVAWSRYDIVLHADLRRYGKTGFHKSSWGTVSVSKNILLPDGTVSVRYSWCRCFVGCAVVSELNYCGWRKTWGFNLCSPISRACRDEDWASGLPDSVGYLRIQASATKKSIPTLMKARGLVVPTDCAAAWTVTFSPARFVLTFHRFVQ